MKEIIKQIDNYMIYINDLLNKSNKSINKGKNSVGKHIQHSQSHGLEQLYCYNTSTKTRKYIKSKDIIKYAPIMQRDYDISVNKTLLKIQKKLTRISKDLKEVDLELVKSIYETQSQSKKKFINPIIESDEVFIKSWYDENQGGQNSYPIEGNIYTSKGEKVRSKSEKILADLFQKYSIPYVYEPRIKLENGQSLCPDFAILNKRTRKTIYWEHLGLIDQDEYAVRTMEKFHEYQKNNLRLGENLLLSMESSKSSLNTKIVEEQIKMKCM